MSNSLHNPECCDRQPLDVGSRVRLWMHQYPRAFTEGTGTILEVLRHHRTDHTFEYRVSTDAGTVQEWNHVVAVIPSP